MCKAICLAFLVFCCGDAIASNNDTSDGDNGMHVGLDKLFPKTLLSQVKTVAKSGRIVNGKTVSIESLPFILRLRANGQGICGASVISNWYALTAAHCLENYPDPSEITLYGGSTSQRSGGIVFQAEEIVIHPKYRKSPMDYDVAIVGVETPFTGYKNIAPVALQDVDLPSSSGPTMCYAAGWGLTNYQLKTSPDNLQQAWFRLLSFNECRDVYEDITPRVICIVEGKAVDVCNGDSGGPLICNGKLTGVASFTAVGCGGQAPAGYAKVTDPEIRQFIREITEI
uniref:Peptidase S1 domain-containing protein n=1 Tax=Anopheles farauti TaxID=69004 RepID=A0A182QQJ2_9DIPT